MNAAVMRPSDASLKLEKGGIDEPGHGEILVQAAACRTVGGDGGARC